MREENQFHGTGFNTMEKTGLTPEERLLSNNENLSFLEKVEKLHSGAQEIITRSPKFVSLIKSFSDSQGGPTVLAEEHCEKFLNEHNDFPYEAAMVRAIAEEIQTKKERFH